MTNYITGSNIIFTNNSDEPDIYLKPANGKNLIIDGTLEDFDNAVFETLLVTESTDLRNTTDVFTEQINALTTTRTDFTTGKAGAARAIAAYNVGSTRNHLRTITSNDIFIGLDSFSGSVKGEFDTVSGTTPFTFENIETMSMPFSTCSARRYGESIAIYENDVIMTSSGANGSDHTALYSYNSGTSEWEFIRFFETGEAFTCDVRPNTACTDNHIMTKSGATWTLSNIGVTEQVYDCCCTVINGSRVFFHALDNGTTRIQGFSTITPSIQATSIHVSDGFSFSGVNIARFVALYNSILYIYTVSSDGSVSLLQFIDLLESYDIVRITRSADLIVLVKSGKASFCSFFNGSYFLQSNVVSSITIDFPISTSKRSVALTEDKLFIASYVNAKVYEYSLAKSALSVGTAESNLTVDSRGIQTSGYAVNISADNIGLYTTDSTENIMRYLVVGSGGPGGFNNDTFNSGGGGAGQLVEGTLKIQARDYVFNVSVGDSTISQDLPNIVGESSTLTETQSGVNITAYGGGQGAGTYPPVSGGGGGGVGSGAYPNGAFGFQYNGTTFKGGDTATIYQIPGGGAGSNGDGQQGNFGTGVGDLPYTGGLGGAGTVSNITGANITYAAGGQGAIRTDPIIQITPGVDGAANTGNGGSGGYLPGSGGSGVVIVRFPTLYFKGYTGIATLSLVGTDTVLKFTEGTGTFSLGVPAGVNVLDDLNIIGETVAQKKLTTWKDVEILDTTPINGSDATEGALRVVGGIATDGSLFVGGGVLTSTLSVSGPGTFLPSAIFQGKTWVSDNTASTSTTTGALVVNGGVGIGENINCSNITRTNRGYGYVFGSGTQSIPNNTNTTLNSYWNSAVVVNGPITFSSGVFTVSKTGMYLITTNVRILNNTTGNRDIFIVVNDASNPLYGWESQPGYSFINSLATSAAILLTSGQNIRIKIYQNSGGALSMDTFFNFRGYFSITEL